MKTITKSCPKCEAKEKQHKMGFNRSGTQRCICRICNRTYTLEPKKREYSEEEKKEAIKMFYSGVSGRGVGKHFGFSKANVYNWIKETQKNELPVHNLLELDELYHFVERKAKTETRENAYLITMVGRNPRQIVGSDFAKDKSRERIQKIVDGVKYAEKYCTDGFWGYQDVIYPGKHIRNIRDKSDAFTVESINADLRHCIPTLARQSRCFARSFETMLAVLEVFIDTYNAFGEAKARFRELYGRKEFPFAIIDYI